MQEQKLVDHSPHNPQPRTKLSTASNLVLIDNYDSFTWNVYQYLVLEGATVTVFRNDEISLAELIEIKPTQLVISPGPGHPDTDAGISCEAIRHFAGKIPIFGVCMGEQCIFSVFGGKVEVTGEILHGKTSPLRHDSKGIYKGIPQEIPVTRYHSLAGTHRSLPDSLEVTSWIPTINDGTQAIIMGVRHKTFVIEGVQFHPESILTEEGRIMLQNFLKMDGGTWAEISLHHSNSQDKGFANGVIPADGGQKGENFQANKSNPKQSILEQIFDHRRRSVSAQKLVLSQRPEDLQSSYDLGISPPQISFVDRLRQSPYNLSLMAEIKRASPSKGIISLETSAPQQARKYARAGASVISVLTEPEWFKGSIDDLRSVRQSLEGMPNRPAVLRKEFIFDEYQILEARLAGADTVLLIVKMLDEDTLRRLYQYSQKLGMEPLVEVNTLEEMDIATGLGAHVVGVNNRNLTNFEVDLDTTSRLMHKVPKGTIVCALSGISGPKDVTAYSKNGVGAVLVGEALMRATNTAAFVQELLGGSMTIGESEAEGDLMVKICGTRSPEAAKVAIEAGADFIGIILVEGRTRCVSRDTALAIAQVCKTMRKPSVRKAFGKDNTASEYFEHTSGNLRQQDRALLVGVFQHQTLSYILEQQRTLDLDIVQLHGSEPIEWASLIPVPVIRRFGFQDPSLGRRGYHALPLLDSALGGTGQTLDVANVRKVLQADEGLRVVLAGGLTPSNVKVILEQISDHRHMIVAVDVSSGVEEGGLQSMDKIRAFVAAAKVRAAKWVGSIPIVTYDWLESENYTPSAVFSAETDQLTSGYLGSLIAGHLMPVHDYIVDRVITTAAKDKMRRRFIKIESFEKEWQDINKQLQTDRYQIHRDTTGFAFNIILIRLNLSKNTNERYILKLCETIDVPKYYACISIHHKPGRNPDSPIIEKDILAPKLSDFETAFAAFETTFCLKTGIPWSCRDEPRMDREDAFATLAI
ncbi:MAG: hypothetical protein Q9182_002151 [Xanthomendoza sp. 2 TL-2023]